MDRRNPGTDDKVRAAEFTLLRGPAEDDTERTIGNGSGRRRAVPRHITRTGQISHERWNRELRLSIILDLKGMDEDQNAKCFETILRAQ